MQQPEISAVSKITEVAVRQGMTSRIIRLLVPILTVFLLFDLEYTVGTLVSQGERLGHSTILVNGILTPASFVNISVKVSDIVILIIFAFLCAQYFIYHRLPFFESRFLYHYGFLMLFVGFGLTSLLWNAQAFSAAQFFVSLLYLAKFFETCLIFALVHVYFKEGGRVLALLEPLVIAALVAALIGLFYTFTGFSEGWLIQDRIQFLGYWFCWQ